MNTDEKTGCGTGSDSACFPEFKRLKYFYGQMLGAGDFQTEQGYFREKLKLHNRCLHGYGTICGLIVVPAPEEPHCESESDAERRALQEDYEALKKKKAQAEQQGYTNEAQELDYKIEKLCRELEKYPDCEPERPKCTKVWIECGLALDCEGNELIVRRPREVDLWHYLDQDDRKKVQDDCCRDGATLYLSLCYCELPVDPIRPVVPDACGATPGCTPGKLLDTVRVRVTTKYPTPDPRCETCCEPCQDPCLLLARIDHFKPGHGLKAEQIHNGVRRLVDTPYSYATITGISWQHGAKYDARTVKNLLFDKGLKVKFSRPVWKSTLNRGVVDLWVVEGGGGTHANIHNIDVELHYGHDHSSTADYDHDHSLTTDHVTIRARGKHTRADNPDPDDRYIIIIRAPFILDECCRPLDGAHVGGRVPLIDDREHGHHEAGHWDVCPKPPPGYGPWTSGTGYPGANFESWFYVAEEYDEEIKYSRAQE